jgi:glucokinase
MDISKEQKVVMTLDAGGTNFVFSAISAGKQVVMPQVFPSNGNNLDLCLKGIINGFSQVKEQLQVAPVAISFAFPGPADYPNGIIGDLANLPAFRGGVALGPMLEEEFGIPVFINNDGDLFAYGEAICGFLPMLNNELTSRGEKKQYRNLLGITLGTGFGAGIVQNGRLYIGDNSAGAEIWVSRNLIYPTSFAEESISIRAVQREYAELTENQNDLNLTPEDIYKIAIGAMDGNVNAAKKTWQTLGLALGDVLANAITLLDCNVVIGGGLSNAYPLFAPTMMEQLNGSISTLKGRQIDRLEVKAYNFCDEAHRDEFFTNATKQVEVYGTGKTALYNYQKRVAIGKSTLGTSEAVALGAYAFAISSLESIHQ